MQYLGRAMNSFTTQIWARFGLNLSRFLIGLSGSLAKVVNSWKTTRNAELIQLISSSLVPYPKLLEWCSREIAVRLYSGSAVNKSRFQTGGTCHKLTQSPPHGSLSPQNPLLKESLAVRWQKPPQTNGADISPRITKHVIHSDPVRKRSTRVVVGDAFLIRVFFQRRHRINIIVIHQSAQISYKLQRAELPTTEQKNYSWYTASSISRFNKSILCKRWLFQSLWKQFVTRNRRSILW